MSNDTNRPQTLEQWRAGRNFKLSWYESCWDAAFRAGEISRDTTYEKERKKLLGLLQNLVGLIDTMHGVYSVPCAEWIMKQPSYERARAALAEEKT